MTDDPIERMLAEGWIVREGNGYLLTGKGSAAMRRGLFGAIPGHRALPIDSVLARARPSIRKKKHRKASR
jgi:hypothetical protein